jgi:hypothetical protein
MTDGGDGLCGWVPSQETRDRISHANTGKTASESTKKLMSSQRRGVPKGAQHKVNIGLAHRGKTRSLEARLKQGESRRKNSAALSERTRAYHEGLTTEQKRLRSESISAGMARKRFGED